MKKMPIPKRKGKNRAQAKGSTWEFELLGAFSGLVLLVCAGLFFFSQESGMCAFRNCFSAAVHPVFPEDHRSGDIKKHEK